MKNILNAPFIKEVCKTTANMYRIGWDERNGGNISLMVDEDQVKPYLNLKKVIKTFPIGFKEEKLIGKIFVVTGRGKYFKKRY